MTKREKLLAKLRRKPAPRDFTWDELVTVMMHHGFELQRSKGGSHCYFVSAHSVVFNIAKPHPDNTLKKYQITEALSVIDQCDNQPVDTSNGDDHE